jgi:hypothetical protein
MARRRRRTSSLEKAGETVGRTLGHLAARWAALDRQRTELTAELTRLAKTIVGGASPARSGPALIKELGRRRGGRPKGFKMSEATKRKLRAAWKRRKAEARAKGKAS